MKLIIEDGVVELPEWDPRMKDFNRKENIVHDKKFGIFMDGEFHLMIIEDVEVVEDYVVRCTAILAKAELVRFGRRFRATKVWYDFNDLDNFNAMDVTITIHSIEEGKFGRH